MNDSKATQPARTCVFAGADDQVNVRLLRAALRNPPPRVVFGVLTAQAAEFVGRANTAIGGDAFELLPSNPNSLNGPAVVVFDGRSEVTATEPTADALSTVRRLVRELREAEFKAGARPEHLVLGKRKSKAVEDLAGQLEEQLAAVEALLFGAK